MTKLALVLHTQDYENYAFTPAGDMDTENPHWKAKGGTSLIVCEIDHTDAIKLGTQSLARLVDEGMPETIDGCMEYHLLDWELVELNDALVQQVKDEIDGANPYDLGYVRYCFGTEAIWDWAVTQLAPQYQYRSYN